MQPVSRADIVDYQTYEDQRGAFRRDVMVAKAARRVHLGEHVTLLFENRLTVRYQIQEMMRVEQIVKEESIQHELDTYNELLGGPGQLGCSLLIEIEDAAERGPLLSKWLGLPQSAYVKLRDGTRVYAQFDPRQVGEDRLSAVQYMKFDTGGQVPDAVGVDHPELTAETALSADQRSALESDLAATRS